MLTPQGFCNKFKFQWSITPCAERNIKVFSVFDKFPTFDWTNRLCFAPHMIWAAETPVKGIRVARWCCLSATMDDNHSIKLVLYPVVWDAPDQTHPECIQMFYAKSIGSKGICIEVDGFFKLCQNIVKALKKISPNFHCSKINMLRNGE